MKIDFPSGMQWLASALALAVAHQFSAPLAQAQAIPTELNLIVVQGDEVTSNVGQRSASWPIVRVEDEKHAPVADCVVVFTLPTDGATGDFNGSKSLTMTTDSRGQAAAATLKMNYVPGKVPIHITASYRGL